MLCKEEEIRSQALLAAAQEIMLAIRTAPKTRGLDCMSILVADGQEKNQLADCMDKIAAESGGKRPTFARDANGVREASAVLLIGVKSSSYGLACGWCGFPTCEERSKNGRVPCVFPLFDLGIGAGVASALLSNKHIDNRMMFSMGCAAISLGWFAEGVGHVLGFPLSVSGKNPYFDRK